MLNNLSIELLKAKRTKSFFIIILVMGVGFGHATAFLQLIFPFGGIAYLSLVDYQKVASQVSYVLATNLGFKLFTYLPIALIYLFLSLYLVEKKGGKL